LNDKDPWKLILERLDLIDNKDLIKKSSNDQLIEFSLTGEYRDVKNENTIASYIIG